MAPDVFAADDPAGRSTVLIVEDNADLLAFIARLLGGEYRILTAADGVLGLEKARSEDVDLIVSDVLMPGMNGYELCAAVKGDPELSHIPFVILTAKTMDIDQIEGYAQGADAYVSKPFNPEVLQAIIRNQFAAVRRRAEYLRTSPLGEPSGGEENEAADEMLQFGPLDRRFLEKLYALFDARLSDNDLNMNVMASEMAISRTSFYRKVKALTGQSPNDFLRSYRLNKAAALLASREYSINEIVDMTGFGTHSYFSSCFKKKFGVNPKDYKKSGSAGDDPDKP